MELDEQQRGLIAALAGGARVRRRGGGWQGGGSGADAAAVARLARAGLVREERDELLVTSAGRALARGDGPGRVLAERALPRDGEPRGTGRASVRRARSVTVNLAESPLGWLATRGLVSERQHDAGERLHADWTRAGLSPSVTMRWDASPMAHGARGGNGALDPTLAQIAAKRRFEEAIAAVGPGLSDILWRTACAGEGMEAAEKSLGWPRRAGRIVLTLALDRLADFYRLA